MGLFQPETSTNGTTTSGGKTVTSPYGPSTSLWKTLLGKAGTLFNQNKLNPYTPLNTMQTSGLNSIVNKARMGQGALSNALTRTQGFAGGSGDVSSQGQLDIAGKAMGPSYAEQNLAGVANGSMLGGNDPNFERLLQKAKEDAATEAGMTASGLGRTGSDFHQTAVADTVGNLEASQRYARLQDQEQRQMAANQQMDAARQAGLGLGLNAQNSATAIDTGNRDLRFNANAAIPAAYQATLDPGKTVAGVGDIFHADKALKNGTGGTNLASLLQILSGTNPFGTVTNAQTGTTTGTNTGPDNTAGGLLGGGLALTSILKGLKDSGGLTNLLTGLI
jgi:hypothetical protein